MAYLKLQQRETVGSDMESEWTLTDHSVQDEDEEARLRELARKGLIEIDELTGEVIDQTALCASKTLICSCGYHTCSLIIRYGLPVPIFKDDIEPIPSQSRRDKRALEIKSERGN